MECIDDCFKQGLSSPDQRPHGAKESKPCTYLYQQLLTPDDLVPLPVFRGPSPSTADGTGVRLLLTFCMLTSLCRHSEGSKDRLGLLL